MIPHGQLFIQAQGESIDGSPNRRMTRQPAMVFDTATRAPFSATVEKAKGDEGVESFLSVQIPNVPREVAKNIPEGAYIQLIAGYPNSPLSGPASIFYGQITLAYDEVTGGERMLMITADAAPNAFRDTTIYLGLPHSIDRVYTVALVLDRIEERTGITVDAPDIAKRFQLTSFSSSNQSVEDILLRILGLMNAKYTFRGRPRFTLSVDDNAPASYRIVDESALTGQVRTIVIDRFSKWVRYTGPTFIKAASSTTPAEDTFFAGRRRDPETGRLQALERVSFTDQDAELTHLDYSVETRFDNRIDLDRVIQIVDNDEIVGYVAGVHTASHTIGREGGSTSAQGHFGQFPIISEEVTT